MKRELKSGYNLRRSYSSSLKCFSQTYKLPLSICRRKLLSITRSFVIIFSHASRVLFDISSFPDGIFGKFRFQHAFDFSHSRIWSNSLLASLKKLSKVMFSASFSLRSVVFLYVNTSSHALSDPRD